MHRPPARLSSDEAIASIRDCAQAGIEILAVEGFEVVPEGFVALLDLIFSVSEKGLTIQKAAAEAETFVRARARPDVIWEVWTDVS
jgi:hypothetical protein